MIMFLIINIITLIIRSLKSLEVHKERCRIECGGIRDTSKRRKQKRQGWCEGVREGGREGGADKGEV